MKHTHKDIIQGCSRKLLVAKQDGFFFEKIYKALPLTDLFNLVEVLIKDLGEQRLENLKNCTDNNLSDWIINNFELVRVQANNEILETHSFILYFNFLYSNRKILFTSQNLRKYKIKYKKEREVKELKECFIYPINAYLAIKTIFEQNNLLDFIQNYLKVLDNHSSTNYFLPEYYNLQILRLKKDIPELKHLPINLTNIDDFLSWEQKNFYLELAGQDIKNYTIHDNLAVSLAIGNAFGDKKSKSNIHELLFDTSPQKEDPILRRRRERKNLLGESYTGNDGLDNELILQKIEGLYDLQNNVSLWFNENEIEEYALIERFNLKKRIVL